MRTTYRSVTTRGLMISLLIAMVLIIGSVLGIGLSDAKAEQPHHFIINMTDYQFTPSHMTWHVGDTVTLTVRNVSQSIPGQIHEFMIGRIPNTETTVFGKGYTDGFHIPFFKGLNVKLLSGHRMMSVMSGQSHLTGMNPKSVITPKGMVMKGEQFMMVFAPPVKGNHPKPGGSLTFQFKVPDKPGKWEMACFHAEGQHIFDGMRGTITIVK